MPTLDPAVCSVQQAEQYKFTTDASGEICVRTCLTDSTISIGSVDVFGEHNTTLPTLGDGDTDNLQLDDRGRLITASSATGLNIAGLITEVTLSSVSWTALPATSLTGRNGVGVQNANAIEIKLNYATPGGYIGWRIAPNGETFMDIGPSVILYAKAASGTPVVTVMEIS